MSKVARRTWTLETPGGGWWRGCSSNAARGTWMLATTGWLVVEGVSDVARGTWMLAATWTWLSGGCGGTPETGSRVQRRDVGDRWPDMMRVWCRWMRTCVAVKVATQPWSQSCPMEMSDPVDSAGKMCVVQAADGSPGMDREAV